MKSSSTVGSHIAKTARHSAIYAVGTVIRRLTAFVMLPIYTRYLTPADYGTVELLTMAIEITSIFVGLRISQALFRYYILAESDYEKETIVSTVLITVIIGSALGVILLNVAATPLSKVIFGHIGLTHEIKLFSYTLLFSAIIATCLSYLRARQKPVLFVTISVGFLIVQVIFNLIFVVVLQLHVLGVIYSALASGALMSIFLLIYTFASVGIKYSTATAKQLILFTLPLIVASIGALYASYADRYFLRLFGTLEDVGLYSLAFRVSSVVLIVFEAFNLSWAAERFEVIKQDNAREIYSKMFVYLNVLLLLVGAGLAIFAQDLFWIMTTPDYYSAGTIVPVLTIAVIIRVYTVFNNLGIILSEKTRYIASGSWLKAIAASIGYISLIPLLGVYGAAIGLIFANLVEFIWIEKHAKKFYNIGLNWKPVLLMIIVTAAFVFVGAALPGNQVNYFIARLLLYFLLIVFLYYLPIWTLEERKYVRTLLLRVMSIFKVRHSN